MDMVCLFCGSHTEVVNSRPIKNSPSVWRRRKCGSCAKTFTTREKPDLSLLLSVENKDGAKKPFSEDKLLLSVYRCLSHRKDALEASRALSGTITTHITAGIQDNKVARLHIAKTAQKAIGRFDKTAGMFYEAHHPIN